MSKELGSPSDRLDADQFDEEGLPGIDADYPPDRSWAVDDPALVNGGSETPDDLRTRIAREHASALTRDEDRGGTPALMHPDGGDPAVDGDLIDDEDTAIARIGNADPDAGPSAEEAAVHIRESP